MISTLIPWDYLSWSKSPLGIGALTNKIIFLQKPDLFDLMDNSPRSMTLIPSWKHCQNPSINCFINLFALAPCVEWKAILAGPGPPMNCGPSRRDVPMNRQGIASRVVAYGRRSAAEAQIASRTPVRKLCRGPNRRDSESRAPARESRDSDSPRFAIQESLAIPCAPLAIPAAIRPATRNRGDRYSRFVPNQGCV